MGSVKHDVRLGTLLVDARLTKPRGLDDKDIDSEPTMLAKSLFPHLPGEGC